MSDFIVGLAVVAFITWLAVYMIAGVNIVTVLMALAAA